MEDLIRSVPVAPTDDADSLASACSSDSVSHGINEDSSAFLPSTDAFSNMWSPSSLATEPEPDTELRAGNAQGASTYIRLLTVRFAAMKEQISNNNKMTIANHFLHSDVVAALLHMGKSWESWDAFCKDLFVIVNAMNAAWAESICVQCPDFSRLDTTAKCAEHHYRGQPWKNRCTLDATPLLKFGRHHAHLVCLAHTPHTYMHHPPLLLSLTSYCLSKALVILWPRGGPAVRLSLHGSPRPQ